MMQCSCIDIYHLSYIYITDIYTITHLISSLFFFSVSPSRSTLSSSSQNSAVNISASNTTGNNSNSMSSPSLGLTNTKVTNSTAKSTGSAGVVSNIPMVSQYIQTGMPFYQQPVYSYEDIQMLQQRIPPHVVSQSCQTKQQKQNPKNNQKHTTHKNTQNNRVIFQISIHHHLSTLYTFQICLH